MWPSGSGVDSVIPTLEAPAPRKGIIEPSVSQVATWLKGNWLSSITCYGFTICRMTELRMPIGILA